MFSSPIRKIHRLGRNVHLSGVFESSYIIHYQIPSPIQLFASVINYIGNFLHKSSSSLNHNIVVHMPLNRSLVK